MLSRFWAPSLRASFAVLLAFAALPAWAAVQAPHRAVYDLSLARASHNSGVNGVDGRMVFEITGSECEGFGVTFRLVNRYSYQEGTSRMVDVQSTTFEAGDGTRFDYQEKELVDNAAGPEKRTVVERKATETEGDGEIRLPKPEDFKLVGGVLFPMQHQLKVIEAAMAGQARYVADVFDGSEGVKTVHAIATIGGRVPPGTGKDKDNPLAKPLQALSAWPITIAYFPEGENSETPNFQITFQMYENGVASNLTLDYGDLALTGKLASLEMLKASDCK